MRSKGGGKAEREEKEKKYRVSLGNCVHLASHPLAGLFELFAFWDVLFSLLHIFLSLLHPLLNVVHQSTLHTNKRDHTPAGRNGDRRLSSQSSLTMPTI